MKKIFLIVAVLLLGSVAGVAFASHSWGGYHWGRTASPFNLKLGDNLSATWDSYLATASGDWSLSAMLDTVIVPGLASPKTCKPTIGRAEICNSKYGRNGWLGVASIWASGNHITQGTVKMNDTYFTTAQYNTSAWRNLVMCQEVGHIFGLDHQDENFSNLPLGTCMDYSNDPNPNQHPNLHDYEMLETLYEHLDATATASQSSSAKARNIDLDDAREWGKEIRRSKDGRTSLHERDFGNGDKVFTFVFWGDEARTK